MNCLVRMLNTRGLAVGLVLLVLAGCAGGSGRTLGTPVDDDREWPQELTKDGSKLLLYQPQIESWANQARLRARMALAFQAKGVPTPELGAVVLEADTSTSLETREVRISNIQVVDGRFPRLGDAGSANVLRALQERLKDEDVVISLDRLLASVERAEISSKPAPLKSDPPKIFVSRKPAILVIFDGAPLMSPIPGNDLRFAVNTNWDLFLDPATKTHYLRDGQAWYKAARVEGPWTPAGALPPAFGRLPADENWKDVRAALPGRAVEAGAVPAVLVSEVPAELILLEGEPKQEAIPGTGLAWVTNTESDLFFVKSEGRWYYLVSGRWFRAASLDGPWSFATPELPKDFALIPSDHPAGDVLSLVPGTKQAQEAVIQGHIPQTARVERQKVAPTVTYRGEPEFKPIESTSMAYAVNTPNDVLKVDGRYYLCFQGVWFVGGDPRGPWELADRVPAEIYSIPPSAPVYHTTYVYVYESDPGYVTYGYLPGYYGVYYGWGVMAFGTGFYYSSYYWGDDYPVYYPYAYTYGAGSWYNPRTGTYGRSAVAYGPYGGVGATARYNPTTGTYARGAAVWGDYGARGFAEAYNPRTDTYARTRQGSNVYGSWGTTAVQRGDDWARTARVSGAGGTAVAYRTSSGGSDVVVRGNNDVYAGRDGQVYQRTGSGWERAGASGAAAAPIDGGTVQSLNQDAQVRSQGAARASQVQSSGGYSGRSGGWAGDGRPDGRGRGPRRSPVGPTPRPPGDLLLAGELFHGRDQPRRVGARPMPRIRMSVGVTALP